MKIKKSFQPLYLTITNINVNYLEILTLSSFNIKKYLTDILINKIFIKITSEINQITF